MRGLREALYRSAEIEDISPLLLSSLEEKFLIRSGTD